VHVPYDAHAPTRSCLRRLRQCLDRGLPLLGVVVILGAVLCIRELRGQVALVVLGMLLLEVGVWQLAHHLLPSERQYLALRGETELFLALVRQLNAAALLVKAQDAPSHRHAFEEIRQAMHQTVERMCEVAGKTQADLAAEARVIGGTGRPPATKGAGS
jgi:nucleotide-binding universal stress UspA family protein